MKNINIKTVKRCAVCRFWYDPSNSAITPRNPKANIWTIDDKSRKLCLKKNYEMSADTFCSKFECKLEVM